MAAPRKGRHGFALYTGVGGVAVGVGAVLGAHATNLEGPALALIGVIVVAFFTASTTEARLVIQLNHEHELAVLGHEHERHLADLELVRTALADALQAMYQAGYLANTASTAASTYGTRVEELAPQLEGDMSKAGRDLNAAFARVRVLLGDEHDVTRAMEGVSTSFGKLFTHVRDLPYRVDASLMHAERQADTEFTKFSYLVGYFARQATDAAGAALPPRAPTSN